MSYQGVPIVEYPTKEINNFRSFSPCLLLFPVRRYIRSQIKVLVSLNNLYRKCKVILASSSGPHKAEGIYLLNSHIYLHPCISGFYSIFDLKYKFILESLYFLCSYSKTCWKQNNFLKTKVEKYNSITMESWIINSLLIFYCDFSKCYVPLLERHGDLVLQHIWNTEKNVTCWAMKLNFFYSWKRPIHFIQFCHIFKQKDQ